MVDQANLTVETEARALPLVTIDCPLCGSSGSTEWGRENGFNAVKCTTCELVYVSPRPDDRHISEATKIGQHRDEARQLTFVYKRSERKIRRYRNLLRSALGGSAAIPKDPVSWLDIGAGFGELIEALGSLLPHGSEIVGLEPMGPKAEEARSRGLPISSDPLDAIDRQFDFVSLINVLSHLPDPRTFIRETARLVKPGGTLLLMTGNGGDLGSADDYPDRLDLPDHLVFAGVDHVNRFLTESGFTIYRTQARRVDTPIWTAKLLVKKLLGARVPLALPMKSSFREMMYVARRTS